MNLLVTGGAGFAGSQFVRSALTGGLDGVDAGRVTVLDRLAHTGSLGTLGPVAEDARLDFVPGDVTDAGLVDVVTREADAIVHLAASPGAGHAAGVQVLLDAAVRHRAGRFVLLSTGDVYGPAGVRTEVSPVAPATPEAAARAAGDLLALAAHRTHGLPVVIVRAAAAHGPWQHPRRLVAGLVTDLLRGRTATLPPGDRVRDRVHVEDLCRAVGLALTTGTPGGVHHVGGTAVSDRDLAGKLLALCDAGADRLVTGEDGTPAEVPPQSLDDARTRRALGYAPRIDLDEGLAATVRWYRTHEPWWRSLVTD